MANLAPLGKKILPTPLPLLKLIGPSFIILGVGLGSGELILWPYLSANFGLGLIWAAILGITFQFFINMEIERYTLATGESIFVGLTRRFGKFVPLWFIFSTFLPWMWPGIAASAAVLVATALGIEYSKWIGIIMLLLMGVIFSLGRVVYKTQERFQKTIILIGIPFIFFITLIFTKSTDLTDLSWGLIGKGDNFWFLPASIPFATFLAAFAYAGAGGNLNLAQSLYIKEKGYGMGKHSGKITSLLSNKTEKIELEGNNFEIDQESLKNFRIWWRRINIEHGIVFWLTGAFTMVLLSLLAYSTVHGIKGVDSSINFVIYEAKVIGQSTFQVLETFFLLVAALMLFGTQFSVLGSNSRIMSENLVILDKARFPINRLSKYFYGFISIQILAGILIFALGFTEPLGLVVIGAVLNAISMFIYSGLILILNHKNLAKQLRPGIIRTIAVGTAFLFYGGFSIFTILQKLGVV